MDNKKASVAVYFDDELKFTGSLPWPALPRAGNEIRWMTAEAGIIEGRVSKVQQVAFFSEKEKMMSCEVNLFVASHKIEPDE